MRIALALALLAAMTTEAAACHRFSVWRYPWPQSCGARVAHAQIFAHFRRQQGGNKAATLPVPEPAPVLPLPGLARADLDGGEADEPTRADVLLRAALEAANVR
jgi:hypothetical protein